MPKWAWYICKSEQHHFFKLWGGTVHNWKKMSICSEVCFLENPTNPRLRWALPGRFVPAQRWLHNIEHGAIVMLYHPCTHHTLVEKLRALVKGCIRYVESTYVYLYLFIVHNFVRKHIISPSTLVSEMRPLVLVGWGCRLEMGQVDEHEVPMSMLMPIFSWDSETLVNLWHIVWWSFIWTMTMMQITVISFQVVDFIKKHGLNGPEGKYPKEGQYTQVSDQQNVA